MGSAVAMMRSAYSEMFRLVGARQNNIQMNVWTQSLRTLN